MPKSKSRFRVKRSNNEFHDEIADEIQSNADTNHQSNKCNKRNWIEEFEDRLNQNKKKAKLVCDEWDKIINRHKALKQKQEDLAKNHGGAQVSDHDKLTINAGGELITVLRGTLTQKKESRLGALFSGRWESKLLRDKDGHIFLDVNPKCFRAIIDYLTELKISKPDSPPKLCTVGKDNEVLMDCLLQGFGLAEELSNPRLDSRIMSDLDSSHLDSLYSFLSEDDVNGELELLYRASDDGWDASDFLQKCDNKGPTVTLIKSTGGYMFGGFLDKPWTSNNGNWISNDKNWISSNKAFLFSLKCYSGLEPTKMKIKDTSHAAYYDSTRCLSFGVGHDIYISSNSNESTSTFTNIGRSYHCPNGQNGSTFLTGQSYFKPEEIEVFVVNTSESRKATYFNQSPNKAGTQNRNPTNTIFGTSTSDFKCLSKDLKQDLTAAWKELFELEKKFDAEKTFLEFFLQGTETDIVYLDVQGKRMVTKRSTLGQFPQSELAVQFNNVQQQQKDSNFESIEDWNVEQVVNWVKNCKGISNEISDHFKSHEVTGIELLALRREDLHSIGIVKIGTCALIMNAIEKLKNDEKNQHVTFIEKNEYCFGKILDQLRIRAMHGSKEAQTMPVAPFVHDDHRAQFEKLVEHYFSNDNELAWFIKKK